MKSNSITEWRNFNNRSRGWYTLHDDQQQQKQLQQQQRKQHAAAAAKTTTIAAAKWTTLLLLPEQKTSSKQRWSLNKNSTNSTNRSCNNNCSSSSNNKVDNNNSPAAAARAEKWERNLFESAAFPPLPRNIFFPAADSQLARGGGTEWTFAGAERRRIRRRTRSFAVAAADHRESQSQGTQGRGGTIPNFSVPVRFGSKFFGAGSVRF